MNESELVILWRVYMGICGLTIGLLLIFGFRLIRFIWRIFDRERARQHQIYVVEARQRKLAEEMFGKQQQAPPQEPAQETYYDPNNPPPAE